MDGCRAPMLSGVWYFMAGRCAPLLHACVATWLAVVLPCFQACGASWLAVVFPFFMRVWLHGLPLFSHASGVGGASRSLAAYCCRAPRTGVQRDSSARRRKHVNVSLSGFFLIGYFSICQLFKFSYRILHAKVFTGENFIKTLFSINYRGYFIIQAAHSIINYSYFLHKTDRKHVENQ